MKFLIPFCLILVTASIAYEHFTLPAELKSNIIPTIEDMQARELQRMEEVISRKFDQSIGYQCLSGCRP